MGDFDTFKKALQDTKSPEHSALVKHVMSLVDISRKDMSPHYAQWDVNDATFRSKVKTDKEDQAAEGRGQPKKMNMPLTFAQIMTFVAFNVQTLTQNPRFYQFEPTGSEDNPLTEPMELIIERDMRKNKSQAFLVQIFLDIGRFTLGCAEVCYEETYRKMRVQTEVPVEGAFGTDGGTETQSLWQDVPIFIGNRIHAISPYRIYPDTRLPLTRYQEGEFCGSEDMFSLGSLQADANLFNLDKIPKFTKDAFKTRKANTRIVDMTIRENPQSGNDGNETEKDPKNMVTSGPVAITKMVVDITPKNFKVGDNKDTPLGPEDFKVRYVIWVANDKTIVRFEEAYYLHGYFPYVLAQFIPDQHQIVNEGLADVCEQITSLITWKLNAHITSQKNSVESKFIIDPAGIDVKGLESRSPYIFLKKNASQTGVDRYIKQFETNDPTANVMQDIAALKDLLEGVTGYSGLMQGQFSQGRRDATQSRAVVQGATSRGKMTLSSIWDTFFEPLGKQLIANNRQEMDFETFQRILGPQWKTETVNPDTGVPWTLEDLFTSFKADPITIATSEDFFVFDASNPSENAFLAQSLQEILITMLSNPQVAGILGYGPTQIQSLFSEIYTLRGVTQSRMPAPNPVPQLPPGQPNILPMPGQPQPAVTPSATV